MQLSTLLMCTTIIARSLPNETPREAHFAYETPTSKLLDILGVAPKCFSRHIAFRLCSNSPSLEEVKLCPYAA